MYCMIKDSHTDQEIKDVFTLKKIAVIGMSRHSIKAAHFVPKYLSEQGFDITPINPTTNEILGKKCYPDISSVQHSIDIVDIFRPSEQVLSVIPDAIKKKPKVIWLQEGIHNAEAEKLAMKEGIIVIFNRCMLAEHKRLF
uniref:CoA-binding domain-containing protein n=2 Tax=root TaxID=1 RepID=A0A075I7V6_9ARCH|nr:CoA-binding domain-containing protein [uncultured marine thaumarchaeote SAT1000_22_C02]